MQHELKNVNCITYWLALLYWQLSFLANLKRLYLDNVNSFVWRLLVQWFLIKTWVGESAHAPLFAHAQKRHRPARVPGADLACRLVCSSNFLAKQLPSVSSNATSISRRKSEALLLGECSAVPKQPEQVRISFAWRSNFLSHPTLTLCAAGSSRHHVQDRLQHVGPHWGVRRWRWDAPQHRHAEPFPMETSGVLCYLYISFGCNNTNNILIRCTPFSLNQEQC